MCINYILQFNTLVFLTVDMVNLMSYDFYFLPKKNYDYTNTVASLVQTQLHHSNFLLTTL